MRWASHKLKGLFAAVPLVLALVLLLGTLSGAHSPVQRTRRAASSAARVAKSRVANTDSTGSFFDPEKRIFLDGHAVLPSNFCNPPLIAFFLVAPPATAERVFRLPAPLASRAPPAGLSHLV